MERLTHANVRSKQMRELLGWTVLLVLMLISGFFVFRRMKEVSEHVKRYKNAKSENKLRRWYAEWPFIIGNMIFGEVGSPSLLKSLFIFLITTLFLSYIRYSLLRVFLDTIKYSSELLCFTFYRPASNGTWEQKLLEQP
jgi:hypothetical protein